MKELTKSVGSLTWAVSLLGLQQLTSLFGAASAGKAGSENKTDALDAITRASLEQCGTTLQQTFDVGDRVQRGMVDLLFRLVPLGRDQSSPGDLSILNPLEMMQRATGEARGAEGASRSSSLPEEELGWGPVPPVA